MEQSKVCRVAIYARVSTEEQAEHGYSIDAQLDILRQYCQQSGKVVAGEYVDKGVSGKEMTKRHELKRMLRDAEKREFDEVVCWKINRLSRKTRDLLEIVETLNRKNVCFRSYSEKFETETPMGRFALQMMGAVGELERNTIVENVKMGLKQRAKMGLHNGGSCLGYRSVDKQDGDRRNKQTLFEIVPEEAVTVQKIFSLCAAGRGFRSIANQLNRDGHRTKKGNTFSEAGIKEILINPVYAGTIRYNRFEGWSEKRRRGKNSNPILVPGLHQPIIERELWEKAQSLLQERSKVTPRAHDGISLLTGLIRCPQCGTPMVASRTVNYLKDGTKIVRRYYSCGQFRSKGSSVCRANSVGADHAELHVLAWLNDLFHKPKILEDVVAAVNSRRNSNVGPMQQELAAIDRNQELLLQRRQRLLDAYEMDGIDKAALTTRLGEITAEDDALHARKAELTYELGEEGVNEVPLELVREALADLQRLFEIALPEQKKALLRLLIKQINITEGRRIGDIVLRIAIKGVGINSKMGKVLELKARTTGNTKAAIK